MTEMIGAYWTIAGLSGTLVGVILLFRYGMPYRVQTGGIKGLDLVETDQNAIRTELRYRIIGKGGLVLIVLGTLAQIRGVLI